MKYRVITQSKIIRGKIGFVTKGTRWLLIFNDNAALILKEISTEFEAHIHVMIRIILTVCNRQSKSNYYTSRYGTTSSHVLLQLFTKTAILQKTRQWRSNYRSYPTERPNVLCIYVMIFILSYRHCFWISKSSSTKITS